jgi:hypothetical protein
MLNGGVPDMELGAWMKSDLARGDDLLEVQFNDGGLHDPNAIGLRI